MAEPNEGEQPAPPEPLDERPERLLIAARLQGAGDDRYLLVRWPDWPHPALLSLAAPRERDSLAAAVSTLLQARMRVRCETRWPARSASRCE
jgi:hypothetical protein